jgi:hypothetical protein
MSDRITCTKCGSTLAGGTITPAEAAQWLTSHRCGEQNADVSDESILGTLRAHEIGNDPRTNRYSCPCGWAGSITFGGRDEAEEHRAQAVRAALLDAQAAAHAAEVERMREGGGCDVCLAEMASLDAEAEALRAEVERFKAAHEQTQRGFVVLEQKYDTARADRDRAVREAIENAAKAIEDSPATYITNSLGHEAPWDLLTRPHAARIVRSLIPEGDTE